MKVLFAVRDEGDSTSIVKMYQRQYKEIISYKNVYYFNAILKELQRDKTYDRIVIDEELEEFNDTSRGQRDKFIFDKLDNISDEAANVNGKNIPVILICSERRVKSEDIFVKLFGIGIYNAIMGNDRSVEEVCKLINQPRNKKQAKIYYRIESEEVNYKPEDENDVSEEEVNNILIHFKKLGNDEEKYVDSFRKIVAQYNDKQMKAIINFLPLNVRAVLEESSPEYQRIVLKNGGGQKINSAKKEKAARGPVEKLLDVDKQKSKITKPIVVPSSMKNDKVKKIVVNKPKVEQVAKKIEKVNKMQDKPVSRPVHKKVVEPDFEDIEPLEVEIPQEEILETKPKRRGRPRKEPVAQPQEEKVEIQEIEEEKPKRRGRPRKAPAVQLQEEKEFDEEIATLPMFDEDEDEEITELPGFSDDYDEDEELTELPGFNDDFEEEDEESTELPEFDDNYDEDNDYEEDEEVATEMPGFEEEYDEDEEPTELPGFNESYDEDNDYEEDEEVATEMPGFEEEYDEDEEPTELSGFNDSYDEENDYEEEIQPVKNSIPKRPLPNYQKEDTYYDDSNFENLLSADKKVIIFVGTSKNGTSFLVNNVAQHLATSGVNTAILDTTQNKNSYYIYTKNDETLRNTATRSITNLLNNRAEGIKADRNLSVYTAVPEQEVGIENAGQILETLVKNHSAVLIDADFNTPMEYFAKAQEIYLVQSLDILTIQPLTAFLRELKAKNIINESKIRIVLNKTLSLKGISAKNIIGGMAFYNDPEMSFMTELFDRNTVKYIEIPFDEEVYALYLEGIVECEINANKYPKKFQPILKELANMVYPLLPNKNARPEKKKKGYDYQATSSAFSSSVNNTLNNMKMKY